MGPEMGSNDGRPTVVGMNEHAPTLILWRLHASFDATRLMMRIHSRAGASLPLCSTVALPLVTGKDAIAGMMVSHIHPICLAELFESSLGCTDVITVLVCHQVNTAKIRTVVDEDCRMLVSLPSKKATHLRNEPWGS